MKIKNATIKRKAGGKLILAGNRKLLEKLPVLVVERLHEVFRDCNDDEFITIDEDS